MAKSKAMTYKARLQQTDNQREESQLDYDVAQAELQMEADRLATKRSLTTAKQRLEEVKSARPLSVQAVLDAQVNVADYEAGLKAITALQTELFG